MIFGRIFSFFGVFGREIEKKVGKTKLFQMFKDIFDLFVICFWNTPCVRRAPNGRRRFLFFGIRVKQKKKLEYKKKLKKDIIYT